MSTKEKMHLEDDTIIRTLVAPDMLQVNERQHLQNCRMCQDRQTNFQQELNEIKHLCQEYLPKPKRNLRPVSVVKTSSPVILRMKNALVYTLMIMICVGGVLGLWPTQDKTIDTIAIEQASDSIETMLQATDNTNQNGTYSILPTTFQYIVADEFEIMSYPFYDYVFPMSTLEIDDS
jgi:hypothetical protein